MNTTELRARSPTKVEYLDTASGYSDGLPAQTARYRMTGFGKFTGLLAPRERKDLAGAASSRIRLMAQSTYSSIISLKLRMMSLARPDIMEMSSDEAISAIHGS